MPLDPRKKQKKLERRKAKDKKRSKTQLAHRTHRLEHRFDRARYGVALDCLVPSELWDNGIGQVLMSRDLGDGRVAFVVFLLDVYCLGVKDVAFDIISRERYDLDWLPRLLDHSPYRRKAPEYVRKLVEDAVDYARSFGLEPHPDYQKACAIFADVDATLCRETFEFGKDGKPLFIQGPYDTPARCYQIVATLDEHCVSQNSRFVVQITPEQARKLGMRRVLPSGESGELIEADVSHDDDSPLEPHF